MAALSFADFFDFRQFLMKSLLNFLSLGLYLMRAVVKVFFFDFLYLSSQCKSTLENVSLIQLLFGKFKHHGGQFDGLFPILDESSLKCIDMIHTSLNWRMVYMIFL